MTDAMINMLVVGVGSGIFGFILGYVIGYGKRKPLEPKALPALPPPAALPADEMFRVYRRKDFRARPILIFQTPSGGLARRFYEGHSLDGECVLEFYSGQDFRGRRGP